MFMIDYCTDINYEDIIDDEKTMLKIRLYNSHEMDDFDNIYLKLSKFSKIKMHFILQDICLENLPESIFDLENIYILDLGLNNLKTISPSISKLKKLEKLYLEYNQFIDFPVAICECKNLKILNMNFCKLTTIPFYISKLTNLQELLICNDLNEFPKVICKLKKLEYLSFEYDILKMPDSLYDLKYTNIDNHDYKKLIYRLKVIFIKSLKKINYKIIYKIIKY